LPTAGKRTMPDLYSCSSELPISHHFYAARAAPDPSSGNACGKPHFAQILDRESASSRGMSRTRVPLLRVSREDRINPLRIAEPLGAFDMGPTRTLQQDVEFGVIQIVDIAPAVNDPSTAISCIAS
jgi:Predicted membrane protein (DUF2254)